MLIFIIFFLNIYFKNFVILKQKKKDIIYIKRERLGNNKKLKNNNKQKYQYLQRNKINQWKKKEQKVKGKLCKIKFWIKKKNKILTKKVFFCWI